MPGQAGPHVAIMMEAMPGLVCVGHEPVITPHLSVVDSSVMGSVWRLPTAQGKLFSVSHHKTCNTSINVSSGFMSCL